MCPLFIPVCKFSVQKFRIVRNIYILKKKRYSHENLLNPSEFAGDRIVCRKTEVSIPECFYVLLVYVKI